MSLYGRACRWYTFHRQQARIAKKEGMHGYRRVCINEALMCRKMKRIYKPASMK